MPSRSRAAHGSWCSTRGEALGGTEKTWEESENRRGDPLTSWSYISDESRGFRPPTLVILYFFLQNRIFCPHHQSLSFILSFSALTFLYISPPSQPSTRGGLHVTRTPSITHTNPSPPTSQLADVVPYCHCSVTRGPHEGRQWGWRRVADSAPAAWRSVMAATTGRPAGGATEVSSVATVAANPARRGWAARERGMCAGVAVMSAATNSPPASNTPRPPSSVWPRFPLLLPAAAVLALRLHSCGANPGDEVGPRVELAGLARATDDHGFVSSALPLFCRVEPAQSRAGARGWHDSLRGGATDSDEIWSPPLQASK